MVEGRARTTALSTLVRPHSEQSLDRAALVHCAVTLRHLVEG
jgi:hypothetical protein